MGKLKIPLSDHRKIRKGGAVSAECRKIGASISAIAGNITGTRDGYGVEEREGTDRTRVNVWAKNDTTERAEAHGAPLLQAAMRVKP